MCFAEHQQLYFPRSFHTSTRLFDQPSSKVESVVESLKQKEKDKVKEAASEVTTKSAVVQPVVKKTLMQKVWAEMVHYYHGFRLLFIDIYICRKLLWQVRKSLLFKDQKCIMICVS